MDIILIASVGNNKHLTEIAKSLGYKVGCRLPSNKVYECFFADQDWKMPNKKRYIEQVSRYLPFMATVLDLEFDHQYEEVISWAEDISYYCSKIIIIPKYTGCIEKIPYSIRGKDVVLGYSVPTSYGATYVPLHEFKNREVHLLGGSPHKQMMLSHSLNVTSADMNMVIKLSKKGLYWQPGIDYPFGTSSRSNHWIPLKGSGEIFEEAFRLSLLNIKKSWNDL